MSTLEEPTRPVRLIVDEDTDLDLGTDAGARPGIPPLEWYDDDPSEEVADPGAGAARRGGVLARLLRGVVAVLVTAGFAGVLWYAYMWGLGGEGSVELPTVRAEIGPEKVKPDDPGGLQVPYQDQLVLDRESGEETVRVERLLPPPEVPLPAAPAVAEIESAAPAPDIAAIEPAAAPEPSPVPAAPEPSPVPAAPEPSPVPVVVAAAAEPAAPEPSPVAAAPAAAEPAEALQVAEVVGSFVLQLASLKTSDAAEQEWTRLKTAFPALLSGLSFFVQAADVESIGQTHRLQIGTFPTHSTAADLCAELKKRQQDCFIVQR